RQSTGNCAFELHDVDGVVVITTGSDMSDLACEINVIPSCSGIGATNGNLTIRVLSISQAVRGIAGQLRSAIGIGGKAQSYTVGLVGRGVSAQEGLGILCAIGTIANDDRMAQPRLVIGVGDTFGI